MAEKNLVELGLVADICCRWTRIGVMAADMCWRIWTRIGGEYVVVVYGNGDEVGAVVVYGSSDDDDAVVIYAAATRQPVNRTRNSKGLDAKTSNLTRRCNRKFNKADTEMIMQRLRLVRIG